jgi:hypothetical protein
MPWKRMTAYITGSINADRLRRIECPLEKNRVLHSGEIVPAASIAAGSRTATRKTSGNVM